MFKEKGKLECSVLWTGSFVDEDAVPALGGSMVEAVLAGQLLCLLEPKKRREESYMYKRRALVMATMKTMQG